VCSEVKLLTSGDQVTTSRLDPIFEAESIAVVGASNSSAVGRVVYGNLKGYFPGRLYAVNSRTPEVQGDQTVADVREIGEAVDLAVIAVPPADVLGVVNSCIEAGHRAGYILTAGFAEAGSAGVAMQEEIAERARAANWPVVGPNSIGFLNGHRRLMANFSLGSADWFTMMPRAGSVGIVSQSGGFGSHILQRAAEGGLGVSMFASTGNECDVSAAELLRYLVEREDIRVVCMYTETLRDADEFLEAARRARDLDKAIISVTPGSSAEAARAVMSHTASVVGSGEVYDAVCRQVGVLRADSIEELIDYASVLQSGKRIRGRRLGIMTVSGGAGALVAGEAATAHFELPELDSATQAKISALMPARGTARNPVDPAGSYTLKAGVYSVIVKELLAHTDALVAVCWRGEGEQADALTELYEQQPKPVVAAVTIAGESLTARGVPTFSDPVRAIRAVKALAAVSSRPPGQPRNFEANCIRARRARDLLAEAAGQSFVLESTAKDVLALYGVPVAAEQIVHDELSAVRAAARIGGAVALKALSYDLPHKSDAGAVILNLRQPDEIRAAYQTLTSIGSQSSGEIAISAVLVQQMVSAPLEFFVGMKRDETFGPIVSLGLGGGLIEILSQYVMLRAPFDEAQASELVQTICDGRVMNSPRGIDATAAGRLAGIAAGVAELSLEVPEITSIDVNPVLVGPSGVTAVDALIVVGAKQDGNSSRRPRASEGFSG
jgi:acetate---CoA ligase (ADP-forming)